MSSVPLSVCICSESPIIHIVKTSSYDEKLSMIVYICAQPCFCNRPAQAERFRYKNETEPIGPDNNDGRAAWDEI